MTIAPVHVVGGGLAGSEATWQIAQWCLEIHGGHGYMKEFGVEKLLRDAAAYLHSDGVNRTLFLKAANFMFRA